jgi:diguanylate cyclase (GGDEF)-like protein
VRGRWGGDEFAVAFPGQPADTIQAVIARVLEEFAAIEFVGDHGERFHGRFSAGVATFPRDGRSVETLLRTADRRLYLAKARGRGRVTRSES